MNQNLTYKSVGVDYGAMDPFKRKCQLSAYETRKNIERLGIKEISSSRGESAYLLQFPAGIISHVEEGLGTKNLVADAMYEKTGKSYYDHNAQDTVAMIVNDMITLQSLPVSLCMHLAVGESSWFDDEKRSDDLIAGWKHACNLSRCAWGGGETPTLKGVVVPGTTVLSGSGIGYGKKVFEPNIQDGDRIVLIESSGIHANGLTAARKIAEKLPEGYLTSLPNGRTYGETLLDPTLIYVRLIEDCLMRNIDIHYVVNITGHGWRKLMRSTQPFTYRIEHLPSPQPIFDFLQKHGPIDDEEAYGNFNMGAGLALYVPKKDLDKLWHLLDSYMGADRYCAVIAGQVEKGEKQVIIEPKNLVFKAETLAVR